MAMEDDLMTFPDGDIFTDCEKFQQESEQSISAYRHLPQDYIRLIQILPAGPAAAAASKICCRVTQCSISSKASYTALSYTWGKPSEDCEILLDGHRMLIRKNLWRFLREARKMFSTRPRWFWIDALCINQRDHQERAQQVSLMPQIYRKAQDMIIWLGPSYQDSQRAMQRLKLHGRGQQKREINWQSETKAVSLSLSMLCLRPYWTRLWIFQEVTLAHNKVVMCGDKVVPWEVFSKLILDTQGSETKLGTSFSIIHSSPAFSLISSVYQQTENNSLFGLILSTRRLQCLEMRDRVFALLGVAAQGSDSIRLNYASDIAVLLNVVLRKHHEQVEAPSNIDTVQNQCQNLEEIFGIEHHRLFRTHYGEEPLDEQKAGKDVLLPIGREGSGVTLTWSLHYNHNVVQELILTDPRISLADWLCHAADTGNTATVQLLLNRGINPNARYDEHSPSALHLASARNHIEITRLLLSKNAVDGDALTAAAIEGHLEIVALLSDLSLHEFGENVNAALVAASRHGHFEIANLLVAKGARCAPPPYIVPYIVPNALQAAAEGGHYDILKLLLDCERPGPLGGSHECLMRESHQIALQLAIMNDHTKVGGLLIRRGEQVFQNGFELAVAKGRTELVRLFLDMGKVRVDLAFQRAASEGKTEIVRMLAEECNEDHFLAALKIAAENGHTEVVQFLLDKCANLRSQQPKRPDHRGRMLDAQHNRPVDIQHLPPSASESAAWNGDLGLPKLVVSIPGAAMHPDQLQTAQILIYAGVDPKSTMLLQVAARRRYDELVRLLLKHGAQVSAMSLWHVMMRGFVADLELLEEMLHFTTVSELNAVLDLSKSFDLKYKTYQSTLLFEAVMRRGFDFVKLLLAHGADVRLARMIRRETNEQDLQCCTAVEHAKAHGREEIVTLLERQVSHAPEPSGQHVG